MRLMINLCHKRGCTNIVKSGFRFCYKSDCGNKDEARMLDETHSDIRDNIGKEEE